MRLLRSLAAGLVLILTVAGLPVLLAVTIGNPLAAWPDVVAGDVTDRVLLGLFAAVAYVAWAQFALAVVVELAAALAHIGRRRRPAAPSTYRGPRRIPGVLHGQQRLAHSLVAALFLVAPAVLPTAALAATPAPTQTTTATATVTQTLALASRPAAASRHQAPEAQTQQSRAPTPDQSRAVAIRIEPGGPGTFWDLAETHLGDGARWHELWDMNRGRHQADGSVMRSPNLLRPGWTVLLPAAGNLPGHRLHEVTVRPGETLSSLAEAHQLPSWKTLWLLNSGRAQPGGGHFTDPDHLEPGWRLVVPAAAKRTSTPSGDRTQDHRPATTPPQAELPDEPDSATPAPHAAPAPPPTPRTAPPARPPERAAPHEETPAATAAPSPTPSSTSPTPTGSPAHESTPSGSTPSSAARAADVQPAALAPFAFVAGGTLLAGVSLLALLANRRRQRRHRRPGRMIASTPTELLPVERALLLAGTRDVRWLDHALRTLARGLQASSTGHLPDVVAARLGSDELELVLVTPSLDPPAPWTALQDGLRWVLRRGPDDVTTHPATSQRAPFPALVSVGYTPEGDQWLLDLERVGALSLVGARPRCLDLLRFMAGELAHNLWSEHLTLTLAGFGEELANLNPDRLELADDAGRAIQGLDRAFDLAVELGHRTGTNALGSRTAPGDGDAWMPQVLLMVPSEGREDATEQLNHLLVKMQDEQDRVAIAVVLAGDVEQADSRWQLHLDDEGNLELPALGLRLHAQQLPSEEASQLVRLLTMSSRVQDEPMPTQPGQPWADVADVSGAPLPVALAGATTMQAVDQSPAPATTGASSGPSAPAEPARAAGGPVSVPALVPLTPGPQGARDSVLPLPASTYLTRAATTAPDIDALGPRISDDVRRRVEAGEDQLDADLAEWWSDQTRRPKLTLLGPLTVRAARPPAGERPRIPWNTEVVAYLACHPRGVTTEQFGTDLWPEDPEIRDKTKVRQAPSTLRKWLGEEYVPLALNPTGGPGLYRVQGLLVDADLFRRLRLRGLARGDGGITDLQSALDLVTGVPFDQRRPGGYAWLADTHLDHQYTAMIVDVAHTVATYYLGADQPQRAAAAAETALRAGSDDDIALLDLLAACDALGRRAEADRLVQRILSNHGAEVEEDLPPRTAKVLHQRRWLDAG